MKSRPPPPPAAPKTPSLSAPDVAGRTPSQPASSLSSEHTICGKCRATAPTQRASTLSTMGWRLGFSRGQSSEHIQRWFCPTCRDGIVATLTQPPRGQRRSELPPPKK